MKSFREYWTFSAIRGVLTMVVAGGMIGMPMLATGILPFPVLLGLTVDVLAAYILLDCGAMILLAVLLPRAAKGRDVLFAQTAGTLIIGGLLYAMVGERIDLRWLGALMAVQAAIAAAAEWIVARDTHQEYNCLSCYATAITLTVCAAGLPFLRVMDGQQTVVVLAAYVGLFGASQTAVGARMLFKEYRAGHPATELSMSWQKLMDRIPTAPRLQVAHTECAGEMACQACAAEAQCFDFSLQGQLTQVRAAREPQIVRTVRAMGVVQAAYAKH